MVRKAHSAALLLLMYYCLSGVLARDATLFSALQSVLQGAFISTLLSRGAAFALGVGNAEHGNADAGCTHCLWSSEGVRAPMAALRCELRTLELNARLLLAYCVT